MSFSIHGWKLPSVTSYAQAVECYEKAYQHPRFCGDRGLKDIRDTSKTVRMKGEQVCFTYHMTDLVTWVSPTHIRCIPHGSISSGIFANRFLPHGIDARRSRDNMVFFVRDGRVFTPAGQFIDFHYDGQEWAPDEVHCEPSFHYVLDRKKAAAIRKKLKAWTEWRDAMKRLKGGHGALPNPWGSEYEARGALALILESEELPHQQLNLLFQNRVMHMDDKLLKLAYMEGGAVSKEPLPMGRICTRPSFYDGYNI